MIKAISALLSFALVVPAYAAFPDVPADTHENAQAISYVESRGIVQGYPDGTFKPYNTINRAEFTKIIVGTIFTKDVIDGCIQGSTPVFPDVPADAWFAKYVCVAKVYGIVQGDPNGMFRPESMINFVEAAKIITVALRLNEGVSPAELWYENYVRVLGDKKAIPITITGFGASVRRGEVAEIIWRINIADHGKPSLTFEDMAILDKDHITFYISKLGDKSFTTLGWDGQTWYNAPEMLGGIGKAAITPLMDVLETTDDYTRTQAFYALRLAAQYQDVTVFAKDFPDGSGEAFPPVSEHATLKRAWQEWYDRYADKWDAGDVYVQLYLISAPDKSDGNGPIGCGDRLVPITRVVPHSQSVLTTAIHALITFGEANIQDVYNALQNSSLHIERIDHVGNKATIRLLGELNLAGICDEPRVEAQITATAKQFTSVETVEIFLNGKPLSEALGGRE